MCVTEDEALELAVGTYTNVILFVGLVLVFCSALMRHELIF